MRDRLRHRGPDGAGWWRTGHVALAHRRLAIMDPAHGAQPVHIGAPGAAEHRVLSYNGELYNAGALRKTLEATGVRFQTSCDTEVIAHALDVWGMNAWGRLRGMYALAWYDGSTERLWLARDPLGIKPLVYAMIDTPHGREVAFASEVSALFDHPHIAIRPDWTTVSAYLTSIRTTLGDRTMYEGIRLVPPGTCVSFDLRESRIAPQCTPTATTTDGESTLTFDDAVAETHRVVRDSIAVHQQSDVGYCALLSGGLDSSIVCAETVNRRTDLRTYCAGAESPTPGQDDFQYAREAAAALATVHTEVKLDQAAFDELWPWMIETMAVPLSTPNEVAIYAVSRALAAHAKVALTGEGADEFFGGYGTALHHFALRMMAGHDEQGRAMTPGRAYLDTTSWIPVSMKAAVLRDDVRQAADDDAQYCATIDSVFADAHDLPSSVHACLEAQRAMNLTGLLGRLDTATMLASVEGRTPFADIELARWARRQPVGYHIDLELDAVVAGQVRAGQHTAVRPTATKRLLRTAFAGAVPASIAARPKASFPLPFQSWLAGDASPLWQSALIRDVFQPEVITAIHDDPVGRWQWSWPVLNIAIWLERIWGSQVLRIAA